jgi:hypothetical protein
VTVSLYSFGDIGPRMKSPWASTFLFFSTANQFEWSTHEASKKIQEEG